MSRTSSKWGDLADKYEAQGYIDLAFDADAEELKAVIAALRQATDELDKIDAERWRKLEKMLRLEIEENEWWDRTSTTEKRRVEERVVEWSWTIDLHPDHSYKFYGTTRDKSMLPKSLADAIDAVEMLA